MCHPPHVSHLFRLLPGAVLGMAGNTRAAMVTASGSTLVRTVENSTAHQRDSAPASVGRGATVRPAPRIRPAPPVRRISPPPPTDRPERTSGATSASPTPRADVRRPGHPHHPRTLGQGVPPWPEPWIGSTRNGPTGRCTRRRHRSRGPRAGRTARSRVALPPPISRASEDRSNAPLAAGRAEVPLAAGESANRPDPTGRPCRPSRVRRPKTPLPDGPGTPGTAHGPVPDQRPRRNPHPVRIGLRGTRAPSTAEETEFV